MCAGSWASGGLSPGLPKERGTLRALKEGAFGWATKVSFCTEGAVE
jgi:hypothetical protein